MATSQNNSTEQLYEQFYMSTLQHVLEKLAKQVSFVNQIPVKLLRNVAQSLGKLMEHLCIFTFDISEEAYFSLY